MPLDTQLGRWVRRTQHVSDTLEQFLFALPDREQILFEYTLGTIQGLFEEHMYAGDGDAPPVNVAFAAAVDPFVSSLREFVTLTIAPKTTVEFRKLLYDLRDTAQTAYLALTSDGGLDSQNVEEVIGDFHQEYRLSLILALTANNALSGTVVRWQDLKSSEPTTGDHLDLTSMAFVSNPNDRTIPMSTLSTASTPDPLVITPLNFAASMRTLKTGGTPPPIYGLAYSQWFASIHAAWEDTYRPRLAVAHGTDDTGTAWTKNDIRSDLFNEIRQIRHDISHKQGVCIESASNTLIDWVEHGRIIAPTPQQMLGLLDLFPFDELRSTPTRLERSTGQLPYAFDLGWIEQLKAHIEAIEPVKKKRPAVLQKIIDDWINNTSKV